ncbi:hypothetical protein EXT42_06550 [Pseudoalteromonas sp. CO302Y]|nr:hypothetical protein EXT42_06550 [Pseudoalteromonas sp. CO302Y]RZG10444.1 hypothetical protein EXT40_06560 [Pseudoalteromonas sp. CO133X]
MLRKIKVISLIALICLLVMFTFAAYRMETCGYDCGLFSVSSGTATVFYYLASLWLGLLALIVLLASTFYSIFKTRFKG